MSDQHLDVSVTDSEGKEVKCFLLLNDVEDFDESINHAIEKKTWTLDLQCRFIHNICYMLKRKHRGTFLKMIHIYVTR